MAQPPIMPKSGEELVAVGFGLGLVAMAVVAACLVYALGCLVGALVTGLLSGLVVLLITQDIGFAWLAAFVGFAVAILIYMKATWGGPGSGGSAPGGGFGGGGETDSGFGGGGGSFGGGGASGSW